MKQKIKNKFNESYSLKPNNNQKAELQSLENKYELLNFQLKQDSTQIYSINEVNLLVKNIINQIVQVNNPQNFHFSYNIPYPEGNFYIMDIKFIPKFSKYITNYKSDSITTLKIPVKGRFEWAIGPAINFGFGNGNFDKSYSVNPSQNGNSYIITENRNNKQLISSIGVMANFYWQNHNWITPGITVGLGSTINDSSPIKTYLGISALIGQISSENTKNIVYNKLIFSAGISYGKVDRLNSKLRIGENSSSQFNFNDDRTINTEQLTEKVGRIGFYFGISYKLN